MIGILCESQLSFIKPDENDLLRNQFIKFLNIIKGITYVNFVNLADILSFGMIFGMNAMV